ncbi:MAG: MbtH family NRPS accessory protein [Paludibacterium sp.]|uniref:MbtH family NRPS accessory protein n=1 Tax=Paludibacterium sp. TaxID=1917523 RepID=UPI0025DB3BCE|nr:MbtH family NRPS accessory protein [Paludibacterium sp.]MBV8047311.1 MbtH family NRPS accessory protein [Paludibacterium sp.]
MTASTDETELFHVVVNEHAQYSILGARQPLPAGWRHAGLCASRDECLDYIESVWTDITLIRGNAAHD